jgi:protein phosphatase
VVIARVGQWVDPDDGDAAPVANGHGPDPKKAGWMKGISGLLGSSKKKGAPPAEEHRYRSCDCPISVELIDRLSDLVRKGQQVAIDQTWPVEWSALADHRRIADKLRNEGQLRHALMELGEAIDLLGSAGRIHRKSAV